MGLFIAIKVQGLSPEYPVSHPSALFSTANVERILFSDKIFAMHCIKSCFDKILQVLKDILGAEYPVNGNLLRPGPKPKFSDVEIIALSLTAECLSIDSELYLFNKIQDNYRDDFPQIVSRRQYNDRRKGLFQYQNILREKMAAAMNEITDVFAVDSMPMEICKMARMERNKMGKEDEYSRPDKGYCASQDRWYYGYKLHAACAPTGVIQTFNITKASIHDNNYLEEIGATLSDCIVTGDKGYILNPDDNKSLLLRESNITMEVPYRKNQKDKKPQLYVLKKIRKRVETIFSQLCDQFMMQRNYAKSFAGYKTRILAKISGMTMLQYLNKFINLKPVGQIKYALRSSLNKNTPPMFG